MAHRFNIQNVTDNPSRSSDNDLSGSNCDTTTDKGRMSSKRRKIIEGDVEVTAETGVGMAIDFGRVGNKAVKDSKYLQGIFPEEIWLLITAMLDSNSLESVSNASPYFRHILLPKRVVFLFPTVWNILAVEYHKPYVPPKSEEDEEAPPPPPPDANDNSMTVHCTSCGRSRKIRWYSEILKLRLVCRKWSNCIDDFYQNLPRNFTPPHSTTDVFAQTSQWTGNNILSYGRSAYLRQFLRHFRQSHEGENTPDRSPFFARSCVIGPDMFNPSILNELSSFLEKYGQHVWYCSISITPTENLIPKAYAVIKLLLERMPNLKEVSIESYINTGRQGRLQQVRRLSPLPTMANLYRVRTKHLPTQICNQLIQRNRQIIQLDVDRNEENRRDLFPNILPLSNLKQLKMQVFSEQEFQILENFPENQFHLERLKLGIGRQFEKEMDIEWARLFTLLENKWAQSLTHLELTLPADRKISFRRDTRDFGEIQGLFAKSDRHLEESLTYRLNLPKLKSLKVKLKRATCLDFILPMKDTLEILDVAAIHIWNPIKRMQKSVKKRQVIQFLGYRECLLKSNIWPLFPKLQRLNFADEWKDRTKEIFTHTRQEWQQEMEMNLGAEIKIKWQKEMKERFLKEAERKTVDASTQTDTNI